MQPNTETKHFQDSTREIRDGPLEAVTHHVNVKDIIYPANSLLRAAFLRQTLDSADGTKSQMRQLRGAGAARGATPHPRSGRQRGATPRPRSGAVERSYPASKVRGGREELPHIQGQEQWPRGATPCPKSGAVAERSYPMSKVRSGGHEEIPHVQGKRNPLKTVGVARGCQRAETLKP